MWRFDQGRLDYFQFDEIKKIAAALSTLDGTNKPVGSTPDIIRRVLDTYSDLPFAPEHYYVWRNYGRVFGCLLLASNVGEKIVATELCKTIANNPDTIDCDDYLTHFAKNFYYPSPIFQGYSTSTQRKFPAVAIIKFLISEFLTKGKDHISIDEIIEFLISNNVSGLEDINHYGNLARRDGFNYPADARRQLRELIRFVSQFSFLKWINPTLYLEVRSKEILLEIEKSLTPRITHQNPDPSLEILNMSSGFKSEGIGAITLHQLESLDEEFTEGKKIRVAHLRAERSNKLKGLYFSKVQNPQICRMCDTDTAIRYPWAEHVIELHHLLPLCSPIRVESTTTSLRDLVGLCPSCHRATHRYYSKWLKEKSVKDFESYEQALLVYNKAKSQIVLNN